MILKFFEKIRKVSLSQNYLVLTKKSALFMKMAVVLKKNYVCILQKLGANGFSEGDTLF